MENIIYTTVRERVPDLKLVEREIVIKEIEERINNEMKAELTEKERVILRKQVKEEFR